PPPPLSTLSLHDALPICGPEGGFCCALDADSEGVEGKFYAWTLDELREALGPGLADEALDYFRPREFEHGRLVLEGRGPEPASLDRKSTRLNSSHVKISY